MNEEKAFGLLSIGGEGFSDLAEVSDDEAVDLIAVENSRRVHNNVGILRRGELAAAELSAAQHHFTAHHIFQRSSQTPRKRTGAASAFYVVENGAQVGEGKESVFGVRRDIEEVVN